MKWIKYIAIPLIVLIFGTAVALVIVLVTLDDDDYLRIAQQLIYKTTGKKLAVAGEFKVVLGWETVLQAQGVTLADPKVPATQSLLADLQEFKIKLALLPLVDKTLVLKELVMRDAVITLPSQPGPMDSGQRTPTQDAAKDSIPFFLPVLEQVQINRMAIVMRRPNSDISVKIWLEQFSARERGALVDTGKVELGGQGHIDDLTYRIDGTIGTIETFLDRDTPYPLDVTFETLALTTHMQGSIRQGLAGGDLKLQISSQGPELAKILSIFGIETPPLGKIDLRAAISGSTRNPQISDLKLTINKPPGLDLTATGGIEAPLQFQKIDLALAGTCQDPVLLEWLLPETVPPVEVIELKGHLRERQRSFFLECAPLTLKGSQGAQLVGKGSIWVGGLQGAPDPRNQIDLQLSLQAPSVAAPFKADTVPSVLNVLYPLKVTGALKGRFDDLALSDVALQAGNTQAVGIEATGGIDRIRVRAEHPVSGVLFKGSLYVTDPAVLIPDHAAQLSWLGPLRSDFKVMDANGALNLTGMVVQFEGSSPLEVAVKGSWSASDRTTLELNMRTSATDLAAVPDLSDIALPDFKAIDLQVKVVQLENRWDVTAFEARCFGEESEALRITGDISGVFGAERSVLTVDFWGDLTQEVYSRKGFQFYLLEQVKGQSIISRDAGSYSIEKLAAECEGLGDISTQLTGFVTPVKGSYKGKLDVNMHIADPQVLFAIFGIQWPRAHAIDINGSMTGNDRKPTFAGQIAWGENQMATTLAVDLRGPRPRIEINATSKAYKVARFGRRQAAKAPTPRKLRRNKTSPPRGLFSQEPLDLTSIKDLDLLLRVQAGKMSIAGLELADVDLNFNQAGGRLILDPLSFNYTGGHIGLYFALDASKPKPDWVLDFKTKSIDLEQFLTDWKNDAHLGGKLNLALNLKSQGKSVHDIAAALTGDAGFAIDQGWVPHGVDLLAADVFDALLTIPSASKRKDLNCLVARFDFKEGVGTSRILSMDTDDFSALGGGTINLRNETLDLLINPKQKKRLVMGDSSPVRIFGPLTDLSFSKMPYREAAKLYGDIIIPVIGISDRVLGYLWDAIKPAPGEESPCYVAPSQ